LSTRRKIKSLKASSMPPKGGAQSRRRKFRIKIRD
jgi:hypothetical protein